MLSALYIANTASISEAERWVRYVGLNGLPPPIEHIEHIDLLTFSPHNPVDNWFQKSLDWPSMCLRTHCRLLRQMPCLT